jgi:putative dimethyl sulfoxide reductase chaperone
MSEIGHNELARSALERSRLYALLATVFRREPSAEFLCQLKTPELIVAMAGAGIDLGNEFGGVKFVDLSDELSIEFTRLFLGPGKHISPHESVQLKRGSGILWGPETSAVKSAYREAGFDVGEGTTEIPDHLCVELDFLSRLAGEEADAWQDNDRDQAARALHLQHKFISGHLGKWVAGFCRKVEDETTFTYYAAFADLLRGYLSGEKSEIVQRLEHADAAGGAKSGADGQDESCLKIVQG